MTTITVAVGQQLLQVAYTGEPQHLGGETSLPVRADIPAGDYVLVAVAGTGVGIPPTMLTKIFLPFITTKDKGT